MSTEHLWDPRVPTPPRMTRPDSQGGHALARAWHTVDAHGVPGFTHLTPFPGPEMGGVVLGCWAGSSGALCCETPQSPAQPRAERLPQRPRVGLTYAEGSGRLGALRGMGEAGLPVTSFSLLQHTLC